jgi:hypothetical protein
MEQADLRGGRPPWFARAEQRSRTDITQNLKSDALVVGGGITGSLIAKRLTRQASMSSSSNASCPAAAAPRQARRCCCGKSTAL